jgi:hypothetical protein
VVAIALAATALAVGRRGWPAEGGAGPVVATGLAVLAVIAVGFGYFEQRHYLDQRYSDPAAVLPTRGLDAVILWSRSIEDARIGTTTTRQYPLYGTDLSNHVQYIGIDRPSAGFTRPTTCEAWREAVDQGSYDYLVTALDRIEEGGPRTPPERAWTASSASAREILRDGPASVYRLAGPLDPEACVGDLAASDR